jgi:hypothetical protein
MQDKRESLPRAVHYVDAACLNHDADAFECALTRVIKAREAAGHWACRAASGGADAGGRRTAAAAGGQARRGPIGATDLSVRTKRSVRPSAAFNSETPSPEDRDPDFAPRPKRSVVLSGPARGAAAAGGSGGAYGGLKQPSLLLRAQLGVEAAVPERPRGDGAGPSRSRYTTPAGQVPLAGSSPATRRDQGSGDTCR